MRVWLKMEIALSRFKSQRSFARRLGKSDDWISRIIQGVGSLREEEKVKIASALGVPCSDRLFFDSRGGESD